MPDGGFMEENTGVFSISIECPDGRSLRGSIGTLSGLSPIQEPTVLKDLPFRVRAVFVYCDCSILFLALDCLVQRSPAGGETELFRALTGVRRDGIVLGTGCGAARRNCFGL